MQKEIPENTNVVIKYLLDNSKFKVKILNNPKVLASIDVDFGVMKVKGFMVREKDGKLWVNPPSRPAPPPHKWPRMFWSENAEFWGKLSDKILTAYNQEKDSVDSLERIAANIDF